MRFMKKDILKKRKKGIIAAILAAMLAAAVLTGTTGAYLTAEPPGLVNRINLSTDSVNAVLLETQWDGVIDYRRTNNGKVIPIYEYRSDKAVYGYEDGDYSKPIYTTANLSKLKRASFDSTDANKTFTYGSDDALNMIPGKSAAKNPVIKNTSDDCYEWTAMKITFLYASGADKGKPLSMMDMLTVGDIIEIDYNSDLEDSSQVHWERIDSKATDISQVFYYKDILQPQADTTTPLFTKVGVKKTASSKDMQMLQKMGGFVIYVEGFAVQEDNFTSNYEEYRSWGQEGGVVFSTTPTEENPLDFDETGIIS